MPSILVMPDAEEADAQAFMFKEHVSAPLLDDPHFTSQLIERLAWAVQDAEQAEQHGE